MSEQKEILELAAEEEKECLSVHGNDVYFYDEVTPRTVMWLNKTVRELEAKSVVDQTPINVFIHSEGGDLMAGFSAMDHLRETRVPVVTVIDGMCASAATVIALGGHTRLVKRHAFALIHQLSTEFWGRYEDMKDEMKTCKKLMRALRKVYVDETKIPEKTLDTLLQRDVYFDAQKCVKLGVADAVYRRERAHPRGE